jgi:hypothetical protein
MVEVVIPDQSGRRRFRKLVPTFLGGGLLEASGGPLAHPVIPFLNKIGVS